MYALETLILTTLTRDILYKATYIYIIVKTEYKNVVAYGCDEIYFR